MTLDLIERFMGLSENPYINIKYCIKCPKCPAITRKKTRSNLLTCDECGALFCYICNKTVSGREHYDGVATCHEESDPINDL